MKIEVKNIEKLKMLCIRENRKLQKEYNEFGTTVVLIKNFNFKGYKKNTLNYLKNLELINNIYNQIIKKEGENK